MSGVACFCQCTHIYFALKEMKANVYRKSSHTVAAVIHSLNGIWTSLVAQRVKHLPTMQETRVRFLGGEDPLEKEMATHSSTLAWKIPWTEEPGGLQSMGLQRVRHDWASFPSISKWKIRMVFCPSYRFSVKNSEWSKTAEAQESGLRTYHIGFWK